MSTLTVHTYAFRDCCAIACVKMLMPGNFFLQYIAGSLHFPPKFPAAVVTLLNHMLALKPEDRYSINDVYRDHWVRKNYRFPV
jgi:hypothetical protein